MREIERAPDAARMLLRLFMPIPPATRFSAQMPMRVAATIMLMFYARLLICRLRKDDDDGDICAAMARRLAIDASDTCYMRRRRHTAYSAATILSARAQAPR